MMKVVEQLLEHNDLLNKCIKEKSFKIITTGKKCGLAKRFETTELNEGNEKDKKIKK